MPQSAVQRVEFDGEVHEFPADFSEADIRSALASLPGPEQPSAVSRFGTQLADRLKENVAGVGGALKRIVTDPGGPSTGVGNLVVDMVKGAAAPLAGMPEAGRLLMRGEFGKATGQAMESLPIAGPMIKRADDLERSGDTAGAFGSLTGDVAPLAATEGAGRVLGAGADVADAAVKGGAGRLWNLASGNRNPTITENVLSRGRGTLTRGNTEALRQEAAAGDVAAVPPSTILGPNGQPVTPGSPAITSHLWPSHAAHESASMPTLASHLVKSTVGGAIGGMIGHGPTGAVVGAAAAEAAPVVASGAAQAAYSLPAKAAMHAAPDASRAALIALLGSQQAANAPQPMASHDQVDRSQWDKRADGSTKGDGFLGVLKRPDGRVSSEISYGTTDVTGKEMDIPLLVPTLTPDEVQYLLKADISKPDQIPPGIVSKAVAFARQRVAAGKPVFAQAGESQ